MEVDGFAALEPGLQGRPVEAEVGTDAGIRRDPKVVLQKELVDGRHEGLEG
jgi:hypothetical protein